MGVTVMVLCPGRVLTPIQNNLNHPATSEQVKTKIFDKDKVSVLKGMHIFPTYFHGEEMKCLQNLVN